MGRRGEMGRCAVVQTDGLLCGTGSLLIRTKGDVTADYLQKIISFPSFKNGSIVEVFTDLSVWVGIKKVIDQINANAIAA